MAVEPSRPKPLPADLDRIDVVFLLSVIAIAISIGVLLVGPPLIGALGIAVGTAVAATLRPAAAITTILVAFPFQPLAVRVLERDFGVSGTALVVASAWKEVALGAVLITVLAPRLWRVVRGEQTRPRAETLDVLAILLIVLVALGVLFSPTLAAVNQARLLLFPIGMYLVLRVGLMAATRVMRALLISGTAIAVFGIIEAGAFGVAWVRHYFGTLQVPVPATFTATFLDGPRASGTLGSPNEFAFMVGASAIIAVALMVNSSRQGIRLTYGASLFVLLPALALSFSRSAFIGCAFGLVLTVALGYRAALDGRGLFRLLAITLGPALLIASLLFVTRGGAAVVAGTIDTVGTLGPGSPGGPDGPSTTGDPGTDSSTIGHVTSLTTGLRLLGANPLGIGLGNVGAHGLPGQAVESRYVVESWYLSVGLSLSVLGLIWAVAVLMSMAIVGARAAIRDRRAVGVALAGIAGFVCVVSFFLPTMLEPQLAMIPWAIAACVVASPQRLST